MIELAAAVVVKRNNQISGGPEVKPANPIGSAALAKLRLTGKSMRSLGYSDKTPSQYKS
jgi:hypothetical protein